LWNRSVVIRTIEFTPGKGGEIPMENKQAKKEDFGHAVLQKIVKEKIRTLDLKSTKTLLEILELLASAKVKSLSNFREIIQSTRPEAMEKWIAELNGAEAD